jgi:hypothetical protein
VDVRVQVAPLCIIEYLLAGSGRVKRGLMKAANMMNMVSSGGFSI